MMDHLNPMGDFRRWLWNSPSEHHDSPKLELPGAWEPPDGSGPLPVGEGEASQSDFLHGNQTTICSVGMSKIEVGI